jgi:hypothetical protein
MWAICASIAVVAVSCDSWIGISVRNDGTEPLTIHTAGMGKDDPPALPGQIRTVGYVGGSETPDLIVEAYDLKGTLVYCRRFSASEWQKTSRDKPVSLKPGDLSCR